MAEEMAQKTEQPEKDQIGKKGTSQNKQQSKAKAKQHAKILQREQQEKTLAAMQAAAKDVNGYEITSVFIRDEEYIIYEIKTDYLSDSFKIYIHTKQEKDISGITRRFEAITVYYAEFKSILYKVKDPHTYKTRAALLMSKILSGNQQVGTHQFKEAISQFESLIENINKDYSAQFKFRLVY